MAVLGFAEVGLRRVGYGGYPAVFREVGDVEGLRLVELDWPGPESYFFQNHFGRGSSYQQSFFMPKNAHQVRIFLCGESAIKGDPQPLPLSAGAFLELMLEDLWPGTDVEIVNLGVTAVASYPVLDILRQAVVYEPDLVIIYTGNNEFYGTYGVASQHFAGTHPVALRATRALHGLAVVQWVVRHWLGNAGVASDAPTGRGKGASYPATLMDAMMRRQEIGPESGLRAAAARNLEHHVREMVGLCRARGVPVMVCTLACNERNLAPMGTGVAAREAYRKGDFQGAIDLDTRPWRPTSLQQEALVRAAGEMPARGAHGPPRSGQFMGEPGEMLCDVRGAFRAASPGGVIGWELMDDHVHPSLQGQYVMARAWVGTLAAASQTASGGRGPPWIDPEAAARLPWFEEYAQRLGNNVYEQIAVQMGMMSLFRAGFLLESNPGAVAHAQAGVVALGRDLPKDVAKAFDDAMRAEALTGGRSPVSGLAGRALMGMGRYGEAEPLFDFARRALPRYAAARREYAYCMYWCREKRNGELSAADRDGIRGEIRDGEVLLKYGSDPVGKAEFFMGKFYEMLGEGELARGYLERARERRDEGGGMKPET